MNNSFGKYFRVSLYGGSHDRCVGLCIDGVPAGLVFTEDDFERALARRRPGERGTTSRTETDVPQLVSGFRNILDGIVDAPGAVGGASAKGSLCRWVSAETDGSRITMEFENRNIRPSDYSRFRDVPRPGHVDFVTRGMPEFTGGGMFSGRMTVALVAAGVVANRCLLRKFPDVVITSRLVAVGGSSVPDEWPRMIDDAMADGDSIGGVVETEVTGLPVGLGEPFFDSVESLISHIVFSIPGVRGIEFGDGFSASAMRGSDHNDPFGPGGVLLKNGAGGINGGLTNGAPVVFRTAFKPTSTISRPQRTWNFAEGRMTELKAKGRHDCCFALRTPVILEAVTAIVFADLAAGTSL